MESADVEHAESDQGPSIDLKRYVAALIRYVWLIGAVVVLAVVGAVIYTNRLVPIYEATASVQIEPKLPDLLGTGDMFNVAGGNGSPEYYKQQQLVIGSYTLCQQTVQANDFIPKLLSKQERAVLSKEDQLDVAARRLMANLKVKYPIADRIMYVSVRSPDAQFAKDAANAHITTYVNYAKGLLALNSSEASGALEQEFNDAEQKLQAAENQISKFQADNDMIAVTLEEHQSLVASNILAFTQKLNDATGDQIRIAARIEQMKKASLDDVLSSPLVMMSDTAASSFEMLRTQYYQEKTHLIELEKDLGPKNSEYVTQKQKVDELYKALEGQLKILLEGTEALYAAQTVTVAGLAAQVEHYKKEAKALSPKIAVYNDLMRNKRAIEDNYTILRTRLSTANMTSGMSASISNVRPLDPALLPTVAVYPRMSVNVAVAAAVALLFGIGFVILVVFLDRSIKSASEANQSARAPVLGVIPAIPQAELLRDDDRARDMFVHEHPTSHIAECCRTLRTNIMLSNADDDLKMLVVCSANKSEGKTTSALYLGTTMAQSNQRVLLIDTDMRRPRLHNALGVSRERGLTNLILGEDIYDDVVLATEIPNLYVLPCGPLPPNPVELLMTKRFSAVLSELGKRFDRIILDSPPLPYTDAVVLSKLTAGVILVVRASKTQRDDLSRAARTFREVGTNVLGVIVNDLDRRDGDAAYYYYYSYYGYGDQARDDAAKRRNASRAARRASGNGSGGRGSSDDANVS